MPTITTHAINAHTRYRAVKHSLAVRIARLREEPEAGVEQIPWTMIMMIGGAVVAVGIVAAIVAYVHAQLAQLPSTPTY